MINKNRWDKFNLNNFAEYKDVAIDGQNAQENDKSLFEFVELDEFKSEHISAEPYSYWKSVMRTFIRKPSAIIALASLALLVIGVVVIPIFTPPDFIYHSPELINSYGLFVTHTEAGTIDLPPSSLHYWGTDAVGRDLFFMTWYGARVSIILALISSTLIVLIGTVFGLIWGFFKKTDPFFVELYNLISNIPQLLLFMLLSYVLSQSSVFQISASVRLIISLTIASWIGLARFVRNQTIIITNREYNIASKTLGTPAHRVMLRNLLPYLLSVIITQASLIIPAMISSEVTMSFFGLGLQSNSASIGALLNMGRTNFEIYPWELLAPAGVLSYIIFTFFLMGLSLTDALDPKKHR